jgi:adenylyl-sulfate kinase
MTSHTNGFTLWFTGLSGAGKSTLANAVADALGGAGRRIEILDGDEVRTNLSKGLGFSREDRDTNIRRIGFVARLLSRNGVIAITAAISPYRDTRDEVRQAHEAPFVEVFVECPLDALVARDVKGLYAKALRNEIAHFTGVSDPYEPPHAPDIHVHSDTERVEESRDKILAWLRAQGLVQEVERPVSSADATGASVLQAV